MLPQKRWSVYKCPLEERGEIIQNSKLSFSLKMIRKVETESRFSEAAGNVKDSFVVIKYSVCGFW